jgi:hypothetical protein
MAFLGGRMILEFEYRRSKMEKIYRRIRTVYTIANTEISNSYFQDRYQQMALHWASVGGHAEVSAELLSHGADISPVNEKVQTFLHLAVQSRSVETVRIVRNLDYRTISYLDTYHIFNKNASGQGHRDICSRPGKKLGVARSG